MACAFAGLLAFNACAQKNNPPKAVTDAFAQKFPDVKNAKWDMENDSEWEAEFKMGKMEYSANFSNDGKWMETEHEVDVKKLPSQVTQSVMSAYPNAKIEEAGMVEKPGNEMMYELDVEADGKDMEIVIDKAGKIINKKIESKKDSEDND